MTLDSFPKREYAPADFEPMYDVRPYSFELNEDWLAIMAAEFDMEKSAADFSHLVKGRSESELDDAAKGFFEDYGTRLMKRSLELGEQYMDRTYEVLKEACDKTDGYLTWPLVPQRFIEAAVLSAQDKLVLPVIQNSHDCLQFRVEECLLYSALSKECGEATAQLLPCRHGCFALIDTAFRDLGLEAITSMTAAVPQQEYCEFTAIRI